MFHLSNPGLEYHKTLSDLLVNQKDQKSFSFRISGLQVQLIKIILRNQLREIHE